MSELLVTIPVTEYTAMVADVVRAKFIAEGIMGGAKLSYSGDKLLFDDDIVSTIIKSVLPKEYEYKLAELKGKKGERYDAV